MDSILLHTLVFGGVFFLRQLGIKFKILKIKLNTLVVIALDIVLTIYSLSSQVGQTCHALSICKLALYFVKVDLQSSMMAVTPLIFEVFSSSCLHLVPIFNKVRIHQLNQTYSNTCALYYNDLD